MSIDSKEVLYSKGKNDECETQEYAVLPILEYLSTDNYARPDLNSLVSVRQRRQCLCPIDSAEWK